MLNSKSATFNAQHRSEGETLDDVRLGPSIDALGAALTQFINARLALFKAEWQLSLSALALSFVALVALGALLAMTWFAGFAALSYGVAIWLNHWLWGLCFFGLCQLSAITLFWRLSRRLVGKIGFQHSLAIGEITHVKPTAKT